MVQRLKVSIPSEGKYSFLTYFLNPPKTFFFPIFIPEIENHFMESCCKISFASDTQIGRHMQSGENVGPFSVELTFVGE